jgi:hypothetical protein
MFINKKNRHFPTSLHHEVSYTIWWYMGFRDDGDKWKYAGFLIKNIFFCSEYCRNFYIIVLHTGIQCVNKRFEYFARMETIQDDSRIVSINVRYDFLGLADLYSFSHHGSYSQWLWCYWFFNSRNHTLVNSACTLCDIEQALLLALNDGYANKFQRHILHLE